MNYETELQALKDAKNRVAREQLDLAKNQSLNSITTQETELKPKYQLQRNKANAQSQLKAKNFAEYLANRGLTNSGSAVQGELARTNQLNANIGDINTAENEAMQALNNQRTEIGNTYNQNLAQALGNNETDFLQNRLAYRKELEDERKAELKKAKKNNEGETLEEDETPEGEKPQVNERVTSLLTNLNTLKANNRLTEGLLQGILAKNFQAGVITENEIEQILKQYGYQ